MQDGRKKNFIFFFSSALFVYICIRKELFDRNTPHITEFATVAKSLPHSLKKLISRLFLIYSYFNIVFFYEKTLGIKIHFRNGSLKKIYIGTLEASCIQKLNNLLNNKL